MYTRQCFATFLELRFMKMVVLIGNHRVKPLTENTTDANKCVLNYTVCLHQW